MGFRPITVYVVECDVRGCTRTVDFYDYDADRNFEMRLDAPELSARTRREIAELGWFVSGRVLCPSDARHATDVAMERIEVELTHDPLFETQQADATEESAS